MRPLLRPPPFPAFDVVDSGSTPDTITIELQPGASTLSDAPSDLAIGFVPHQGENRRTRLKEAATWKPGKGQPSRRELWEQRKRFRRGTMKGKA